MTLPAPLLALVAVLMSLLLIEASAMAALHAGPHADGSICLLCQSEPTDVPLIEPTAPLDEESAHLIPVPSAVLPGAGLLLACMIARSVRRRR